MISITVIRNYASAFLILIIIISGCKSDSSQNDAAVEEQSTAEDGNGTIILEDIEARNIILEEYRGKVVVLNFWATWCKPCIAEMPSIDRMIAELGEEEYVYLAASDENLDKIKKFVEKNPHQFQYAHLKTNIYKLGLSVLPTTFIINREGEVVERVIGAREWDSKETIELLRSI